MTQRTECLYKGIRSILLFLHIFMGVATRLHHICSYVAEAKEALIIF